ncbi:hypothetical protein Pan14r_49900 [Crateriforma conspicua]|uniref:Uncharacterized protein n=1 Tax=Crateriforma conspicua TaxID=2527996 RepID=A0A5C5YBA7_9PLAN|nr:hypothetical protein Pan14r_49900 [Crateriforma conspicua]
MPCTRRTASRVYKWKTNSPSPVTADVIRLELRCVFGQDNALHQLLGLVAFCGSIYGLIVSSGLVWAFCLFGALFSAMWFLFIGHGLIYPLILIQAVRELFSNDESNKHDPQ